MTKAEAADTEQLELRYQDAIATFSTRTMTLELASRNWQGHVSLLGRRDAPRVWVAQRVCCHVPRGDENQPRNFASEENKCRITFTIENGECRDHRLTRIRMQLDEIHAYFVT